MRRNRPEKNLTRLAGLSYWKDMNKTRIYLPIGGFLLGLGVAAAGTLVPWIPEWFGFQAGLCLLGWTGALVAGIFLVRGAWLQSKGRMETTFRWVVTIASALVMAGIILFGALISALNTYGGIFPSSLRATYDFPENNATVYLYDSGFLDPETTVKLRSGFLPVMRRVAVVRYYLERGEEASQSGDWVDFGRASLNLETGEFRED